ncbi:cellulose synthase D5 [Olea europaea subsp. europaea]|uniref:Cellulose synthase D5 n=1 Tax=Olea europaea subsp. europaea TaxID=158383 RepID=A0A8S0TUU2_OLEEU|nr:cellulose synthase D5 [Olea europaea subsp. europaea]
MILTLLKAFQATEYGCFEDGFALSWILYQLPKNCPVKRVTNLSEPNLRNPKQLPDLPRIDVFLSTTHPNKELPLVIANTILSILAIDYLVEKISCYRSDDGGSLVTFDALAEAASFARLWVPFYKKHKIEMQMDLSSSHQKSIFPISVTGKKEMQSGLKPPEMKIAPKVP